MKAKDIIKALEENPEAEVVYGTLDGFELEINCVDNPDDRNVIQLTD